MASEDVLERALKAQRMIPRVVDIFEQAVFIGSVVDDLAAEVRELRKDKARLDWLDREPFAKSYKRALDFWWKNDEPNTFREVIDAAMENTKHD